MKSHKCIRPNKKNCEWRDKIITNGAYCIILSEDKPCIEEEVIMEKIEQRKPEGREKIKWITNMIEELTAYLDLAPNTDIMDRVNDACGHLRKTRIHLKQFYQLNDE